ASSQPIGPAPITARRGGRSVSAKTVSLVRKPASASPGIGGRWARAGRDHGPAEAKDFAGHLHRVRAGESGLPEVDIDAEAPEPSRRVVGTDPGSQPTHAPHDRGKTDLHAGRDVNPELWSIPNLGGGPGGPEQRLGRHAADVEAIASQEFPL